MTYAVTVQRVPARHVAVVRDRRRWAVASTVHTGPYAGLGAAHAAVIDWCARHGRTRADVWWEVYGDWHEDAARLETEVVYALASGATP